MNKCEVNMPVIDVFDVVSHLREHEQYQPEKIKKKIEPWIVKLEKLGLADPIESAEVGQTIAIIREAVMLGLKEIDAKTYVDRYVEAKDNFFKAEGVSEGPMVINDDASLAAYNAYHQKYMAAYDLFHQTKTEFAGFPLERKSDQDYSPAERNALCEVLNEYRSGEISVRLARSLRFRKPYGEPVSIYPSDHAHSIISTLANVYGVDIEGYLADLAASKSKSEVELKIENTKLSLGIKHKSEEEVIREGVEAFAKHIEPKN